MWLLGFAATLLTFFGIYIIGLAIAGQVAERRSATVAPSPSVSTDTFAQEFAALAAMYKPQDDVTTKWNVIAALNHYGEPCADLTCGCVNEVRVKGYAP